jgi:hypothetical protein
MQRNSGWRAELRGFLVARAWTRPERLTVLFDQAVAWLRTKKVLLPGGERPGPAGRGGGAEAGDRGMRVLCGCRRLAQGLAEPVNASVDDVRVAKGGDVGQSLGDAHGGVRRSRRAVPCQCGHEPVRGFHGDVDVVLPALKQDRRPMSEVLEVGDRV